MIEKVYDFIIVGGGPAGCTLAWRLSHSSKKPSVLLIEAGDSNDDPSLRISGDRYITRLNPELNHNYKTVHQAGANDREIDFDRGRGLGGSTAINFGIWNVGTKDDHDEVARLTGDDAWKWENARERYKRIENFHAFGSELPEQAARYLKPELEHHGQKGPIDVSTATALEPIVPAVIDIWTQAGYPLRTDPGDGQGIGIGVQISSAHNGLRTTAASMIRSPPANLHVIPNTSVHKVIFEGKRAIGVQSINGGIFRSSKEVILSAGALDTPKILMISGVGPPEQLIRFGIPVVHENDAVGQNLSDHIHISPTWEVHDSDDLAARDRWYRSSPEEKAVALEQWKKDGTGPFADICTTHAMGMFKSPAVLRSEEFAALPLAMQSYLHAPTTPSYEVIPSGPTIEQIIDPLNTPSVLSVWVFLLNLQSRGSATLQSADPTVPLLFDPKIFEHPFDRRLAIEALREVMQVAKTPSFAKRVIGPSAISGLPKSDNDDDLLTYWREHLGSTWHGVGTCKIGRDQLVDEAVVDPSFQGFGVDNLRIADLSILPFAPNNHTQTTAYLVGLMAGDRLVDEYNLDN